MQTTVSATAGGKLEALRNKARIEEFYVLKERTPTVVRPGKNPLVVGPEWKKGHVSCCGMGTCRGQRVSRENVEGARFPSVSLSLVEFASPIQSLSSKELVSQGSPET